jgi:hypothetical protein
MGSAAPKLEVAYRVFGEAWKRRTMTAQALDRLLVRLMDKYGNAFEVRTREAL